nr:ankyrin repeat-containing domain, PGG domain protein [Tanacetum cinerariifolium]
MIIQIYPDAILSDSDVVLTTLAQNFPRELNFWERRDGSTLLHVAAIGGNIEAVKMLVERNPELLLAKDKEGHTPLALSVSNMHIKTSKCLFEHMKVHGYGALFEGLAEMIIQIYPDAILSDSDVVLTTLAQNFPRELNFWERRGDEF